MKVLLNNNKTVMVENDPNLVLDVWQDENRHSTLFI